MKTKLQLTLTLFLLSIALQAQWTQTNGPFGGRPNSLFANGSNLYAGTNGAGVFRSTNSGNSWTAVNMGLGSNTVNSFAVSNGNLFAGADGGVFLSTNNGSNWTAVNTGLPSNTVVTTLAVSGSDIYAGTFNGVFRSTDNGTNWTAVNTGLTQAFIGSLAVIGSDLFAGTFGGGVFLSSNSGASWRPVNTGLSSTAVTSLIVSGSNLYAGTNGGGVFLSTNNGNNWASVNSGLSSNQVKSLAVSNSNLYAGTPDGGIFRSTNNGITWTAVNTGLTNTFVVSVAASGSNLYASTNGGIFVSIDNGISWSEANTGLVNTDVQYLASSGSDLFAACMGYGIFRSTDKGATWTSINTGLTNNNVRSLVITGSNLYAGTDGGGVFFSTDNGTSWNAINAGLTQKFVKSLAVSGSNLYAATNGGIFVSYNNGTSWTALNAGLPTIVSVNSIATIGSFIYAGTSDGVYRLPIGSGVIWTALGLTNPYVKSFVNIGNNLFAGSFGGGVFLSTDDGVSWTASNTGLTDWSVYSIAVNGGNLFASTSEGVFLSIDNGQSWTAANTGLADAAQSLVVSGSNLFAGTSRNGVWAMPLSEFVAPPTIITFAPISGPAGSSVTITGTNFNTTPANNVVVFGATRATVTAATSTQLTVTVPAGATYAPITVLNTTTGLLAYSKSNFTPTFSPNKGIITAADFNPKVDFTAGANPWSVAIGDLDGDGKADLAVTNYSSNAVSVYRNTSSIGSINAASFAPKVDFTTGSGPFSASIGDLDGDGKPDLVVANRDNNTVSVFRNTSISGSITSASFAPKVDFTAGGSPISVSIGDLDGDGKADLAVPNLADNTISVYRNTSSSRSITNASFAPKVDFATGTQPIFVAMGDIDGDDLADLAVANYGSTTVSVYRNAGNSGSITTASFVPKVDFTTGVFPYSVSIGDLDGDGKADLVVANNGNATVSLYRNTSSSGAITTASFAAKVDLTTGDAPTFLAMGDLDGDSKVDLAVANRFSNTVSVIRNMSSSGSITASSFAAKVDFITGTQPIFVAINDLDGDGKADLAVANYGSNTVSVIRNNLVVSQSITFAALPAKTFGDANFAVLATASSGLPVTYSSSNTAVATIAGSTVTIVGGGTSTITASQAGNDFFAAAPNVTQTLTVNKATQSITFATFPTKTFGDASFTLSATASSGLPITYTSSNTSVATIAGSTVTIVGGGTSTITAGQAGNDSFAAAANVTQTLTVNKASQAITFAALPAKTFGDASFTLSATTSSGLPITYSFSNTAVATVSGNTVTVVGVGTSTITASQAGNDSFNSAANVTQTLTVNKASQTITFAALPAKTYGDASFTLSATTSSGLPINYTSSNTAVATISGNSVTIVGVGTSTITASQAGNDSFNSAANVTQTLTVNKANQTITFTPLADKTLGDAAFTLNGVASSNLALAFSTTSDKISISGTQVTLVKAGRTSIVASQAGNDSFNSATSVTQNFCIKPAKPTITTANNTGTVILTSNAATGNQWYLSGNAISGGINQSFSAIASGVYRVQVTLDDCVSEFSAEQPVVITGDIKQEAYISISPNPVEDILQVNGIIGEVKSTQLFDMTGRASLPLVLEKSNDHYQTSVAHLSPGVYLLRILLAESVAQVKFIKK